MATTTSFTASDGKVITYYTWIPRKEIKGTVQIVHGMAEHAMRYDHFATKLRTKGYAVYACDLRGHGQTAENPEELGYLAGENGWFRTADDLCELTEIIKAEQPDQPVYLLGHSMGSFLARTLMITHGDDYHGVILSGTASSPGLLGVIGRFLAGRAVKKDGGKVPNPTLDKMSFGSYNKAFAPNRTKFDWLSRNEAQVDLYVEDPLCGFICTSKFYEDLLTGLLYVNAPEKVSGVPKDLPVLLISGDRDPVGKMGTGVRKVHDMFKTAGILDVSLELIPDARHEVFNETDRNDNENLCISWLTDH